MEMNTELVCVIANLGYNDGDEYFKSIDCLESLKDIIRFLRHDDLQTCDVRRQLGYSKVLQNDLIPLLVSNPDDKWLSDILLRLLVNLTAAPHLCFEQNPVEEASNDSSERKAHEMELMSYLVAYKEAFTQKSAMSVISCHLASILKKDVADRDEDDELLLERILLLIRNLLYVPADPEAEKRTDDDVTIHDQLLWSLHENGIDDLLIYISSSEDERNWCMHACEIISHMFREQNAEELAKASEFRSIKEKEEDTRSLKEILKKEREEKEKTVQNRGARHSRFGGAFWVKGRKALNEEQHLVYHRTLQSADNMSYDFDKMPEKKRRTKQVLNETDLERKSTLSVRLFLKEFCIKFLRYGYNNLLSAVKSSISSGKTQKNDESFYLSVMRFFMTFNRIYDFKVEYISQTIGVQIFSDILRLILKYDDQYCAIKPTKGKERKIQFSRRIHLALKALKELLTYVAVMLKTNDNNLVNVAEVIQSNIFYIEEYRNVFLDLLRHWNPAFQTRVHLKDIIESFHLYLKLFETFLKDKGTFLTRTKAVKRKAQDPKRKQKTSLRPPIGISEEQAENLWQNEISVMLSARIQGRDGGIPDDAILPFDLDSDVPNEEQILIALGTIQRLLRCEQPGEAIAFLRASRECWPVEKKFGTRNMSGEDEFMCTRAIFFMDIPYEILQNSENRLQAAEVEEMQEAEIAEEEAEEQIKLMNQREKFFDLKKFLKGLAVPFVVEPYCNMLKTFDRNKAHTNHCIIKMLTRIAVDLDMFPMLFQLSLFITFKKILQEPRTESNKEVKGFAKYILAKFFDIYKSNPMVVVDLLFWKSGADCYEILEGYGTLQVKRNEKKYSDIGKWNFEEEQELLDLYDELKDGTDVVEKITERLSEKGRTSKQIKNKLIRLRVLEKPKKRKASEWTKEETEELRNLYEEFKSTDEPLTNIMNALSFSKSKKGIISHLLEVGLVEDRKQLHSRRKKKKKTLGGEMEEHEDLIIDEDLENGYEGEVEDGEVSVEESEEDDGESPSLDDDLFVNSSLPQILQKLCDEGFKNEISWIRDRLVRIGNDRETADEDEWQPVPLVPITVDHQTALANKLFKRMLKRVGIFPPSNEQEAFWRVSRSLSPTEIKEFTSDLAEAKGSMLSVADERKKKDGITTQKNSQLANYEQDESDDDIFERFINGNRSYPLASLNDNDEFSGAANGDCSRESDEATEQLKGESDIKSSASLLATGKRTRRIAFSDDDDGDDDGDDDNDDSDDGDVLKKLKDNMKRKQKRIKKIEESDEEEDGENDIFDEEHENQRDAEKNNNLSFENEKGNRVDVFNKQEHEACDSETRIGSDIDDDICKRPKGRKRDYNTIDDKEDVLHLVAKKEINVNGSDESLVLEMSVDEGHSNE